MNKAGAQPLPVPLGISWVLAQFLMFFIYLWLPRFGPAWPCRDCFRVIGIFLVVIGAIPAIGAAIDLKKSLTPFPRPVSSGNLVTSGFYRLVRHPIYFGILLCGLGGALYAANISRLLLTAIMAIFLDAKSAKEEKYLSVMYPEYSAYQLRVKKLLPGIY